MTKYKHYVVWRGRNVGIFDSWQSCKEQIDKFEGAVYKGYATRAEAVEAFEAGMPTFAKHRQAKPATSPIVGASANRPSYRAIAVDAACSGNPGNMEYRGVWVDSGQEIFRSKIYREATNNIGEFLALVHVLALSKRLGWTYDIFSDSYNAILWLRGGKCKTRLVEKAANAEVFDLIRRAEAWLAKNSFSNKVIKWETSRWGEIPADFGRK